MWARLEIWQVAQLQRLVNCEPERAEQALNCLWGNIPGLYDDLAVAAVDQEMLSVEEGAKLLAVDEAEIETRLIEYRQRVKTFESMVVHDEMRKAACLAEGRVPVWEIVLEYRKLGSLEELKASFPGLTKSDLLSALRYAEMNPEEIENAIADYELLRTRRKAEYPFSR